MPDRCNQHGVYDPDEVLTLPRDRKGWRGRGTASIELRDLGTYWIYATNYQLLTGDMCGRGEPLCDPEIWPRRAPSRTAALDAAISRLRDHVGDKVETSHDARRILAWLDSLNPAQADLFGAAA